ncbi:MAG TPA: hypothetical protein VMU26_00705 [Candidatus Polarisedimenticolia bacterium]|nr:hypothetical protein [Candidatus Polarisedimenticolia bacterium]
MSTMSVPDARAALAVATSAAERTQRESALAELKLVRQQGADMQKEFNTVAAQVKQAEKERLVLHQQIVKARQNIEMYSRPLDPLTFPSDEEIADNARQLTLWHAHRDDLKRKYADAAQRESARLRAVQLQNALVRLRATASNLEAIASGRRPGEIAGGLFRVESFL